MATLSFLHAKAGPFSTDEAALLRALTILEVSRLAWTVEKQAYAADRRHAKQQGVRNPTPPTPTPTS